MAQTFYSRQLLMYAVPTIAVLLSYLWYKRKRSSTAKKTDPGEEPLVVEQHRESLVKQSQAPACSAAVATPSKRATNNLSPFASPESKSPRVLSTPSTPIDIVIPRELRSQKSMPIVISDEDLDLEIEKIKSMRSYSAEKNLSALSSNSPARTPKTQASAKKKLDASDTTIMPSSKSDSVSPVKIKTPSKSAERKRQSSVNKSANNNNNNNNNKVEEKLKTLNLNVKDEPDCTDKTLPPTEVANNKELTTEAEIPAQQNQQDPQRQSNERDSANHSPVDVMLASPSLSCISDNHSEGSSDSGKGLSDVATPPSRTPGSDSDPNPLYYEFAIPQVLVGKLIGKYGSFVSEIKEKTHAHIVIKKHPGSGKIKICAIEGSQEEIDAALKMIRVRFPLKQNPELTLEPLITAPPVPITNLPLTSDHLYSKLVEGVNNDTIVSCMVSPGHLFLQQPTHPSYPHLQILARCMTLCYSNENGAPNLPKPIRENTICVSQSLGEWYRTMVLSSDETNDTSYVTFLDYGGFAILNNKELRQIRGDFLLLPFQAAECFLANIKPVGDDDATWSDEAYDVVASLTKGALIQTQIAEYTDAGVPLVLIYILVGPQEVVFLNDELVKRGYAEYVEHIPSTYYTQLEDVQEQRTVYENDVEGAVGGVVA